MKCSVWFPLWHTSTNTLFRFIVATAMPRHRVKPYPNTNSWTFSICLRFPRSWSSHRSGRKTSGSGPKTSLKSTPRMLSPIFTPPGTWYPFMVSPSGGVTRSRKAVIGGKTRSPSLMQACRYGSRRIDSSFRIGFDTVPLAIASSISLWSFAYTDGLVITFNSIARIEVAVVSEPANLS